jgi:hypothetical protein
LSRLRLGRLMSVSLLLLPFAVEAQVVGETCRGTISGSRRSSVITASCPAVVPRQVLTYRFTCNDQCGHQTDNFLVEGVGHGDCFGFGSCNHPITCYPVELPETYTANPPRFEKQIINQKGMKPFLGCDPLDCVDNGITLIAAECECGGPMSDCAQDPLILSLGDSALPLTDRVSGVRFDLNGDGRPEQTPWTHALRRDAFLVLDRNGNGRIDSGLELFGDATPQPEDEGKNGFRALAVFDDRFNGGNEDGRIDAHDRIFEHLRLWVDLNHDGTSQTSEMVRLADERVVGISLAYEPISREDRHGNRFLFRGKYGLSQGADRLVWDVQFSAP